MADDERPEWTTTPERSDSRSDARFRGFHLMVRPSTALGYDWQVVRGNRVRGGGWRSTLIRGRQAAERWVAEHPGGVVS
jgi:hypothetical protein